MLWIFWNKLSFQSLLAQLQNDLGNLKTENRQLSFKYWLKIFPNSCSGQVLLNERLSGLDGGEGDFIILQGDKRQVPFRIRRDQIIGDIWTFLADTLMEEKLVGQKLFSGLRTRWVFSRRGTRLLSPWRQRYQRCCIIRVRSEKYNSMFSTPWEITCQEHLPELALGSVQVCDGFVWSYASRWSQSWTCCKARRGGWYKMNRWVEDYSCHTLCVCFLRPKQKYKYQEEIIS